MANARKEHSVVFKASWHRRRCERTARWAVLSCRYGVHASQIHSGKKTLIEGVGSLFVRGRLERRRVSVSQALLRVDLQSLVTASYNANGT